MTPSPRPACRKLRFAMGFAAIAAFVPSVAGCAAEGRTKVFTPAQMELVACRCQEGEIVLDEWFEQGDDPNIAMEAEAAFHLASEPPLDDPQCSGGRCLVRVDRAEYFVYVKTQGTYVRWSRAFFPQGGGWLHAESMDDGPEISTLDCDGSKAGAWVWVKGPTYDLQPGLHRLWLHNWHGGAKIDKVVLSAKPGYQPQDLGPPSLRRSAAREGYASTPSVAVIGLAEPPRIALKVGGEAEAVTARYRLNGGPFLPAPTNGVLADVQPAPGRVSFLQVQVHLKRPAARLQEISLGYVEDRSRLATLRSRAVMLQLSKTTGGIVALRNLVTQTELIGAPSDTPPFRLRHRLDTGKLEDVPLDDCRLTDMRVGPDSRSAQAHYAVHAGITLDVAVVVDDRQATWQAKITNRSPLDIVEVVFPVLRGVRVGESGEDDLMIEPNWQGGIETARACRHRAKIPYPTGGGMAWLDLYQRDERQAQGFYFASLDPTLLGTFLQADPSQDQASLDFSITRLAHVRSGETWESPISVTGLHAGDWHAAADAYRTWVQSWMKRPNPPEWVREVDGWYGLAVSADTNRIAFDQLPSYCEKMREAGLDYIQVWGQMTGGTNCDSLPYPNPVLGDIRSFKAAIREVQRWGGHITFYVSSQFWKEGYGDQEMLGSTPRKMIPAGVPIWDWKEWRDYAIRAYDGAFSGDTPLSPEDEKRYGTHWRRTILCPFTEAWSKRHLRYWCVDQYGFEYGANGIYLDETSAASERYCFAGNHGHPHHGIWGMSLAATMRDMVSHGREKDPSFTVAMEGCSDAIGQFADMNLISPASAREQGFWGKDRRFAPEVFHYTFPDYILFNGFANGSYGKITPEQILLAVHLLGNRYDVFDAKCRPYVLLRHKTKQFLYRARFMDNLGLRVSDSAGGVNAKVNLLRDEQNELKLINIINPAEQKDVTVAVDCSDIGGARAAYFYALDGGEGPLPVRRQGGLAQFTAPTAKASTVLLVRRAAPLVHGPVAETCAGDRVDVSIDVTNVTANAMSATVRPEIAAAWRPAPESVEVRLAPGERKTVAFAMQVPASADAKCYAGAVLVKAKDGEVRRPLSLIVRDPLRVAGVLGAEDLVLTVQNLSKRDMAGRLQAKADRLSLVGPEAKFSAPAQGTVAVRIGRSKDPIYGPVAVDVSLDSQERNSAQTVIVRPLLLNGSFEDIGAQGLPSGWAYQHGDCASADETVTHEGKRSLRLTGRKGVFSEAHQTIPVEKGATYSVRAWVRRTEGTGSSIGPVIVQFREGQGELCTPLAPVGPVAQGQWQEHRAVFTPAANARQTALYLYNVNSTATVWYDGVEVAQEKGAQ